MIQIMNNENEFKIRHNGAILFVVTVEGERVVVKDTKTNAIILTIPDPPKVFIGESPVTPMTIRSRAHGPTYKGNSILVKTKDNFYVYIGARIYSFTADCEITKYVSEVGNNDVPYPYAVDNKGNFYLFIEDVILEKLSPQFHTDPYSYLYDITGKPAAEILGVTHVVGTSPGEHFNIHYTAHPRLHYKEPWMANLHSITAEGIQTPLTEDDYVSMMHKLAMAFKLRPIAEHSGWREIKKVIASTWCEA
jgi:hypothetical protein